MSVLYGVFSGGGRVNIGNSFGVGGRFGVRVIEFA